MTQTAPVVIYVSELSNYLCPRQGLWSSRYSPRIPPEPLWLGTCIHIGLDQIYRHPNLPFEERRDLAWSKMKSWATRSVLRVVQGLIPGLGVQVKEKFSGLFDLATGMIENYLQYRQIFPLPWTVRSVEVPLTWAGRVGGISVELRGRADLILEGPEGPIIIDHKTYSKTPSHDLADLDLQLTAYAWLGHQLGIPATTVGLNILFKGIPEPPARLKSGRLSKSKGQFTTAKLFQDEVNRLGFDLSEYLDIIGYYSQEGWKTFFDLMLFQKSRTELGIFEDQLEARLKAIAQIKLGDPAGLPIPSLYGICQSCSFRSQCSQAQKFGYRPENLEAEFTSSSLY